MIEVSKRPLVSVCTPVFKRQRHVLKTVQSILNQTIRDLELLVCDDGSNDGTAGYLRSLKDPRVRVIIRTENLGLPRTLNQLIEMAQGEYITFCYHDDCFAPELLEKSLERFKKYPKADVVFSGVAWVTEEGKKVASFLPFKEGPLESKALLKRLLFTLPCPVQPSGTVIRRSKFNVLGGFCPRFGISADLDLWIRIAQNCTSTFAAELLVTTRTRPPGEWARRRGWETMLLCETIRKHHVQRIYASRPVKKTAAGTWISSKYLTAKTLEGLSLWLRGKKHLLRTWRDELRLRAYHPLFVLLSVLAWFPRLGKALGDTRRRMLRSA